MQEDNANVNIKMIMLINGIVLLTILFVLYFLVNNFESFTSYSYKFTKENQFYEHFHSSSSSPSSFQTEMLFLKTCPQSPITESAMSILTKSHSFNNSFPKEISLQDLLMKLRKNTYNNNNNNNNNNNDMDYINYMVFNYPCGYTFLNDNVYANLHNLYDIFYQYYANIKLVYMGLENVDLLAGKDHLWMTVMNHYKNHRQVEMYLPKTYILNDAIDRHDLFQKLIEIQHSHHEQSKQHSIFPLFFKKNLQRKQGIFMANTVEEAMNRLTHQSDYNDRIAQQMIPLIFLYRDHAVTFRVYILGIYHHHIKKTIFYRFRDVKCLYSANDNEFITTSSKNHLVKLYDEKKFPLQMTEMFTKVELEQIDTTFQETLAFVMKPYETILGQTSIQLVQSETETESDQHNQHDQHQHNELNQHNNLNQHNQHDQYKYNKIKKFVHQFQLFGADLILQKNSHSPHFNAKVVEINKGPSLIPVNQQDFMMKTSIIHSVFQIINRTIHGKSIHDINVTKLN